MFVMIAVLEQNCAELRALGITGVSDWNVLFRFLAKVGRGDKFLILFQSGLFCNCVRKICLHKARAKCRHAVISDLFYRNLCRPTSDTKIQTQNQLRLTLFLSSTIILRNRE